METEEQTANLTRSERGECGWINLIKSNQGFSTQVSKKQIRVGKGKSSGRFEEEMW